MNDLWIIGDAFLNRNYHTLSEIKREAERARKQIPYIFDYYNIQCFTPNPKSLVSEVLAKFVNCLVKALNQTLKLPKLVVVIPDDDILRYVFEDTEECKRLTKTAIRWVVNQMIRAVDAKKDNMSRRKPGAVMAKEPKFIWIKMFDRISSRERLYDYREMYNECLETLLAEKEEHYILDVNVHLQESGLFDSGDCLNAHGRKIFWIELDKGIERFDKKKVSLKPVKHEEKLPQEKPDEHSEVEKPKVWQDGDLVQNRDFNGSGNSFWKKKKWFRRQRGGPRFRGQFRRGGYQRNYEQHYF